MEIFRFRKLSKINYCIQCNGCATQCMCFYSSILCIDCMETLRPFWLIFLLIIRNKTEKQDMEVCTFLPFSLPLTHLSFSPSFSLSVDVLVIVLSAITSNIRVTQVRTVHCVIVLLYLVCLCVCVR